PKLPPKPAEAPKITPAPMATPTNDGKTPQAKGEMVTVRGRVLDPKGRPVDGATLRVDQFMFRTSPDPAEIPPQSKSQVDGTFTLDLPKEILDKFARGENRRPVRVVATAPGFGFGWDEPGSRSDALKDMTIRIVDDDHPLEGRVVDLEGRPVAGAVIKSERVFVPTSSDLSSWIEDLKRNPGKGPYDGNDEMPFYEVTRTTGPDGRFRIEGVGRERIVQFTVSGPTVEVTRGFAMTKDTPAVAAPNTNIIAPDTIRYHGSRFDYASAPCKPVEGVVRDQDTDRPLAGMRVNGMAYNPNSSAYYHEVVSVTDDQGRYRLTGMARSDRYRLFLTPGKGQPYPSVNFDERADSPGLEPATINLKLKRGVLIRGRLTDKATGKPVRGMVASFVLRENPYAKDYAGLANGYDPIGYTDAEGRFEVSTLPGPGFIAARSESPRYLPGVGAEAIPGLKSENLLSTLRSFVSRDFYHVFAPTNPELGSETTTCDIQVDPGRTLSLTVVDPEGKQLSGIVVKGRYSALERLSLPLESATLELTGIDPRYPRRVYAFHQGRKLGGLLFLKGVEDSPLELTLEPLGVISGRLVDDEGAQRKGLKLVGYRDTKLNSTHGELMRDEPVDPDGRFRIEVIAGLTYEATVLSEDRKTLGQAFKDVTTGPGETKDLGDVKLTQPAK
ncbi:sigma-70 family RNA polymerase sigma factor, partial [Singulisphaera rosea]